MTLSAFARVNADLDDLTPMEQVAHYIDAWSPDYSAQAEVVGTQDDDWAGSIQFLAADAYCLATPLETASTWLLRVWPSVHAALEDTGAVTNLVTIADPSDPQPVGQTLMALASLFAADVTRTPYTVRDTHARQLWAGEAWDVFDALRQYARSADLRAPTSVAEDTQDDGRHTYSASVGHQTVIAQRA